MDTKNHFASDVLDAIIKTNLVGSFYIDLQEKNIIFSEDGIEKLALASHVENESLSFATFLALIHPQDKEQARLAFESILRGIWSEDDVLKFRMPDIAHVYEQLVLKVSYITKDDGEKVAVGGINDHSKQARLESLNELAFEGMSKYAFCFDFRYNTISFNQAFREDFNIPGTIENATEWLLGNIIDAEHKENLVNNFARIRMGEEEVLDVRLHIFDMFAKTPKWLHIWSKCSRDANGMPLECRGTILDITEEVRAKKVSTLIVEGSSDCIFVLDLEKDLYEFSSKIFEFVKTRTRRFHNGLETWLNFIVNSDRHLFENALKSIIKGETTRLKVDFRLKGIDGTPFW
ncbi:MAG: PAS domain-containing protein, partial [Defluviitaleaceae bacterium]|nr:PAS domain-containing protein [Defluviitaleaceae bacterium]